METEQKELPDLLKLDASLTWPQRARIELSPPPIPLSFFLIYSIMCKPSFCYFFFRNIRKTPLYVPHLTVEGTPPGLRQLNRMRHLLFTELCQHVPSCPNASNWHRSNRMLIRCSDERILFENLLHIHAQNLLLSFLQPSPLSSFFGYRIPFLELIHRGLVQSSFMDDVFRYKKKWAGRLS